MPRKKSYGGSRRTSSRRVSASSGRRSYGSTSRSTGVRRGRSTQRSGGRAQTVRIEIVQPGANPVARPELIGLGLVKNNPRKPL